jgi:hypothetical protein
MVGKPPEEVVPHRNSECDVWSLSLVPFEAFVLSSIDGDVDLAELSMIVGVPVEEVHRTVQRLTELGAVFTPADCLYPARPSQRPTLPGQRPSQRPTLPAD